MNMGWGFLFYFFSVSLSWYLLENVDNVRMFPSNNIGCVGLVKVLEDTLMYIIAIVRAL
jgi:hypothetical protein